jgi:hypothetical protein
MPLAAAPPPAMPGLLRAISQSGARLPLSRSPKRVHAHTSGAPVSRATTTPGESGSPRRRAGSPPQASSYVYVISTGTPDGEAWTFHDPPERPGLTIDRPWVAWGSRWKFLESGDRRGRYDRGYRWRRGGWDSTDDGPRCCRGSAAEATLPCDRPQPSGCRYRGAYTMGHDSEHLDESLSSLPTIRAQLSRGSFDHQQRGYPTSMAAQGKGGPNRGRHPLFTCSGTKASSNDAAPAHYGYIARVYCGGAACRAPQI